MNSEPTVVGYDRCWLILANFFLSNLPRLPISCYNSLYIKVISWSKAVQGCSNRGNDICKTDLLIKKGRNSNFIGRIQHCWFDSPLLHHLKGKSKGRETSKIWFFKTEITAGGETKRRQTKVEPFRIRQRIRNWNPHVRNAELGHH